MRWLAHLAVLLLTLPTPLSAADSAADGGFNGEWRTTFGIVTLKQTGSAVTGTYGKDAQFTLKGTVQGKTLSADYQEGQSSGQMHWTFDASPNAAPNAPPDESAHAFHGDFQQGGGQTGRWDGWRPDPQAPLGKPANLAGLWLTDLGLMELEQTGDNVKGRFALHGVSTIHGAVTGRHLEFTYKSFRAGKGWFDLSADGASFAGAANTGGFAEWFGWRARRAPEFIRHVKLVPGKIVDGSTTGLLTYAVRAPDTYREGDGIKWPAVVILHGSNMNGKAYVSTIAAAWPDIARDYLLVGINGEMPSSIGDEPAFNFTYVDYVGKSTFKGFPGTDRESPALVAEALADLRGVYPIARYFVGGHSQGGFLTYSLLMNFPEQIAGAFPISAGVIAQCEPGAYDDDKLRALQRAVPLAIVHSKQDAVVDFSSGQYAAMLFGEASWPALRFFADDSGAGHRFGLLPIGEAIRWLEAQSSDDPKQLLDFADQRIQAKGYRDAISALNRTRALNPTDPAVKQRLDRLSHAVDEQASPGAQQFMEKIDKGTPAKTWIDDFLAYRDDFEFAAPAHELMQKFNALRAEHDLAAKKTLDEANAAFRQGKRAEGYTKYEQIVDRFSAASCYRNVKRMLAQRE